MNHPGMINQKHASTQKHSSQCLRPSLCLHMWPLLFLSHPSSSVARLHVAVSFLSFSLTTTFIISFSNSASGWSPRVFSNYREDLKSKRPHDAMHGGPDASFFQWMSCHGWCIAAWTVAALSCVLPELSEELEQESLLTKKNNNN